MTPLATAAPQSPCLTPVRRAALSPAAPPGACERPGRGSRLALSSPPSWSRLRRPPGRGLRLCVHACVYPLHALPLGDRPAPRGRSEAHRVPARPPSPQLPGPGPGPLDVCPVPAPAPAPTIPLRSRLPGSVLPPEVLCFTPWLTVHLLAPPQSSRSPVWLLLRGPRHKVGPTCSVSVAERVSEVETAGRHCPGLGPLHALQGDPRRPSSGGGGGGLCPLGQDRGFILWASGATVTLSSSPSQPLAQEVGQVTLGKGPPWLPSGGHKAQSNVPCLPVLPRSNLSGSADTSHSVRPGAPRRDPGEKRCPFHSPAICSDQQPLQCEPRPYGQLHPSGGAEAPAPLAGCIADWLCPAASISRIPKMELQPRPAPARWRCLPAQPAGPGPPWVGGLLWAQGEWAVEVPHAEGRGSGEPPWGLWGEEGRKV